MAAFRFRLAPVLRLRERQREEQRLAFAAVEEERLRLTSEIQQLEERLATYIQEMLRENGQALRIADLQLYGAFAQQLELDLQQKRSQLAGVETRREEQRLALLEADTGVKSLEQFKARLVERHQHAELATAQRQADEVGQRQYIEQQSTGEKNGEG